MWNRDATCRNIVRRRFPTLLVGMLSIGWTVFVSGCNSPTEVPKSVQATSFELVDEEGATHARLFVKNGTPTIMLLSESGEPAIEMATAAIGDMSGLEIYDYEGRSRLAIAAGSDGAGFVIRDASGTDRLVLGLQGDMLRFEYVRSDGSVIDLKQLLSIVE